MDEYIGIVKVELLVYGTRFIVVYIHPKLTQDINYSIWVSLIRPTVIYRNPFINNHINLETWNKMYLCKSDLEESRDNHIIDQIYMI